MVGDHIRIPCAADLFLIFFFEILSSQCYFLAEKLGLSYESRVNRLGGVASSVSIGRPN